LELRVFLGLPDVVIETEPSPSAAGGASGAAAGTGGGASTRTSGKAAAPADWEFPHAQIVWVREIGQGGFGTVFEVRKGGILMAAKKISCTVPLHAH
jgi:hypothetical protein